MTGDTHGRVRGACMALGMHGRGARMVGVSVMGVCGGDVCGGGVCGKGVQRGPCMVGGMHDMGVMHDRGYVWHGDGHASEMTRNTLNHCLKFPLCFISCHICYRKS